MKEIIFEIHGDEADAGFTASAFGYGIHTEGDSEDELRANIREAVHCFFDDTMEAPNIIRLHLHNTSPETTPSASDGCSPSKYCNENGA